MLWNCFFNAEPQKSEAVSVVCCITVREKLPTYLGSHLRGGVRH
jgi:hypothetical protein